MDVRQKLAALNRVGTNFVVEHGKELVAVADSLEREEFFKLFCGIRALRSESVCMGIVNRIYSAYKLKFGGSLNTDYNNRNRPGHVLHTKDRPRGAKSNNIPTQPTEEFESYPIDILEDHLTPKMAIAKNRIQIYDSRDVCILTVDLKERTIYLHGDKFKMSTPNGEHTLDDFEKVAKFKKILGEISEQVK